MKPEPESIQEALLRELAPRLKADGFSLIDDGFTHGDENFSQRMYPTLTRLRGDSSIHLDFFLAVKIHRVEDFLRKFRTHLSEKALQNTCTVNIKMINICPKADLYNWKFIDIADIQTQVADIEHRLRTLAMPFLKKFSSEDALASEIEKAVGNWRILIPTPTKVDRGEILLAIYLLNGSFEKFVQMVGVMRNEIAKENGGYYLPTYDRIAAEMAGEKNIKLPSI